MADFTDASGATVNRNWRRSSAQGRRQHRVRLLDLRRQLDRGRATRWPGATTPTRMACTSIRAGPGLAGQPADSLQPRFGRRRGQTVGSENAWCGGTAGLGRHRRAGLQGRCAAGSRDEPVHHEPRRRGAVLRRRQDERGPFPEHYEPFETPIGINPLHPQNKKATSNPAARIFDSVWESLGEAKDFPYAGTTYRLTEHFHFWSKHCKLNAIAQPEQFVEIGEVLAKEKGIAAAGARVSCKRGFIEAVAVVTKRIRPLQVNGQVVHQIGIPLHWGFTGQTRHGYLTNTLVPFLGDGNTQTPESKSFLVNVEKL
jgi:anaerobic selenocysteine-containing dehydrogenase